MESMPDILFASSTVTGGGAGLWLLKRLFTNYTSEKKAMKSDIAHTKNKVTSLDAKVDAMSGNVDLILSSLLDKK